MASKKSIITKKRVNTNLPAYLVDKVEQYANDVGINTTAAYIVLLKQALDQQEQLKYLPLMNKMFDLYQNNPSMFNDISIENEEDN